MALLGIDAALLNPVNTLGVHHGDDAAARYLTETTNEALAESVAAAPDRLGFFAILRAPTFTGRCIRRRMLLDTLHADGLFLFSNQSGVYLGDVAAGAPLCRTRSACRGGLRPSREPRLHGLARHHAFRGLYRVSFETTRAAANLIYNGYMGKYPNIRRSWPMAAAPSLTLPTACA